MGGMRGDPHDGSGLAARFEPIRKTCHLCEAQDLHYSVSITFGEPGDTRETVTEKLDFLRSIKPSLANLRIGVSVLPGTEVAAQAVAEGADHGRSGVDQADILCGGSGARLDCG